MTVLNENDDISANLNADETSDESATDSSMDESIEEFSQLPLAESLLTAITAMGWKTPSEVQKFCLFPAVKGQDVLGFAQTGTGKTGVFLIAIVHHILSRSTERSTSSKAPFYPAVVVLAPTRELVIQIHEEFVKLTRGLSLKANLIIGGMDMDQQQEKFQDHHDIVVATPGRLKDFVQRDVIRLNQVEIFVCDEVDRMFEIGFLKEVEYFLSKISAKAQKLMFSATSNDTLEELTFEYLHQPKVLHITPDAITTDRITQTAILCSSHDKLKVFLGLLRDHRPHRALIFVNTKVNAAWLHQKLIENDVEASLITGDLPQKKRTSLIKKIKAGRIRFLIATDVASRGLHIPAVTHVYNFDLPSMAANYIHRIGRTARAGAKGFSCSLVCDEYGSHLLAINELIGEPIPCEWYPKEYLAITLKKSPKAHAESLRPAKKTASKLSSKPPSKSPKALTPKPGKAKSRPQGKGRQKSQGEKGQHHSTEHSQNQKQPSVTQKPSLWKHIKRLFSKN